MTTGGKNKIMILTDPTLVASVLVLQKLFIVAHEKAKAILSTVLL